MLAPLVYKAAVKGRLGYNQDGLILAISSITEVVGERSAGGLLLIVRRPQVATASTFRVQDSHSQRISDFADEAIKSSWVQDLPGSAFLQ